MALQTSDAVANAQLDALETTVSTSAVLAIYSGAQPANCAAADSGTEMCRMTLPSDWMAAASSRTKALSGVWSDSGANAAVTGAHFRLYASNGTTCHLQGSVTVTGGGGDLTLDDATPVVGQPVTITSFTLTAGNP